MSHSTHAGFNCPPICSESGRALRAIVAALALPDRQSRAIVAALALPDRQSRVVGVASSRSATRCGSDTPVSQARGGIIPFDPSFATGVGHISCATCSTSVPPRRALLGVTSPACVPSDADGVGSILTWCASMSWFCVSTGPARLSPTLGVSHNPDPVAPVRGADGGRRYAIPDRIIPERGQVSENGAHWCGDDAPLCVACGTKQAWDVFHDDECGS